MKTSFLLPILFLLLTNFALTAQLSLSLEAGVNRTNITLELIEPEIDDLIFDREANQGFFISAIPRLAVNERLSINTEAQYSMESYNWGDTQIRLHNIRLIPELEYSILKSLGIYAGANIGLKVTESYKQTADEEWISRSEIDTNTRGVVKDIDFGLSGGLRYYFLEQFNLTFKYSHGLTNISNILFTDLNGVAFEGKEYNRTFQLGLGYTFNKNTRS